VMARRAVDSPQIVWEPTVAVTASTFFYLRITQRDVLLDEILHRPPVSVTAPIWITVPAPRGSISTR